MSFCLKGWMDTWELTESGRGQQSLALWLGTAEAEWRQQVQSSWRRKPQGIDDPGHQESIESRSFKTFAGTNQAERDPAHLWQAGTANAHNGTTQRHNTGHWQASPLQRLLHATTPARSGQIWQSRRPHWLPVDHRKPQVGVWSWPYLVARNTGTELHMDPDFTSPWNTVLKGHKWYCVLVHLIFSVAQISICHWRWVLMPPEVLPDAFLCDESCSKGKEDDINVLSWYTHVLPQIRHRWSSWKMSNWHQQRWSPLLEHTCSAWTFEATKRFHWIVLKEVLWKQGEGVCAGSRRDNIYAGMYRPRLDFY